MYSHCLLPIAYYLLPIAYSASHNNRWGVASRLGVLAACLCGLSGGAHNLSVPVPGCLGVPAVCLCANRPPFPPLLYVAKAKGLRRRRH